MLCYLFNENCWILNYFSICYQAVFVQKEYSLCYTSILVINFLKKTSYWIWFIFLWPQEPISKKVRQVVSNVKVMVTVFVVHRQFVPEGRTINQKDYFGLMSCIKRKAENISWLLHQKPHKSLLIYDFLSKNYTVMMSQPKYSLDSAPWEFYVSPKQKRFINFLRFTTINEIKVASVKELMIIAKSAY